VPDDHAQVDAERDEAEEDEPETQVRSLRLPRVLTMSTTPRSVEPVRALDGDRIELKRLVDHVRTAIRLGHARQSSWGCRASLEG